MSDERPSEVLGGLPRTRPHRRSQKRASAPGAAKRPTPSAARVRQPPQPPGTPSPGTPRPPVPGARLDLIGSAVHASAELAEIGISAGARALRGVVSRLPKP